MTATQQNISFLLGANDHVIPASGQTGGLLNEADRQALALCGIELAPSGMEQMGVELQNLYAALAQPECGLTVSYPAADVSGGELRPAFVVERLLRLFPALRLEREPVNKEYRFTAVVPALEMAARTENDALKAYLRQEPDNAERLEAAERAASAPAGQSVSRRRSGYLWGAGLHDSLPTGADALVPFCLLHGVRPPGKTTGDRRL